MPSIRLGRRCGRGTENREATGLRARRGRTARAYPPPEDFWTCVDDDHRAILAAVEQRDSMTAMTLMRRHLDHLGDVYKQMDLLKRPG